MLPNTLHISLANHYDAGKIFNLGKILACSAGSACHTGSVKTGSMAIIGT